MATQQGFPKRSLVTEPFSDQQDLISRLVVDRQPAQPAFDYKKTTQTPRRRHQPPPLWSGPPSASQGSPAVSGMASPASPPASLSGAKFDPFTPFESAPVAPSFGGSQASIWNNTARGDNRVW
ncbi:hypothetical protein DICA3_F25818 [Diutina catenulata]